MSTLAQLAPPSPSLVVLPVPLPGGAELVRPSLRHSPRWTAMASDPVVRSRIALSGTTRSEFLAEVWEPTRFPLSTADLGPDWGVVDLALQEQGSGLLLGTVRFHDDVPAGHPGAMVEYALVEDVRSRGLGRTVIPAALSWASAAFSLPHLSAFCDEDNTASARVLARAGLACFAGDAWCTCRPLP